MEGMSRLMGPDILRHSVSNLGLDSLHRRLSLLWTYRFIAHSMSFRAHIIQCCEAKMVPNVEIINHSLFRDQMHP